MLGSIAAFFHRTPADPEQPSGSDHSPTKKQGRWHTRTDKHLASSRKGKEKETVKKGRGQKKGKGKEKAADENDDDGRDIVNAVAQAPVMATQLGADQGIGDDDLDDMYMDVDS